MLANDHLVYLEDRYIDISIKENIKFEAKLKEVSLI